MPRLPNCRSSSTRVHSNRSARANARPRCCATRARANIFDFSAMFVLDTVALGFIIYIWYEDGELRPSLATSDASGARARRQPLTMRGSLEQRIPHEGGDN